MQGEHAAHSDSLEDKTSEAVMDGNGMLETLAYIIQKVSSEVTSFHFILMFSCS